MSLNSATDPQIAALLTLAKGAVNADLAATLGEDAIDLAIGYPISLEQLPNQQLPALAIWRRTKVWTRRTAKHLERLVTVRFDFFSSKVRRTQLEDRWPLLNAVEESLFSAVVAGKHSAVSGGAGILEAAGIVAVDENSISTAFAFVPNAGDAFPAFQATCQIRHRTEIDTSALADLLDLAADYRLDGLPEAEQPLVADLVEP